MAAAVGESENEVLSQEDNSVALEKHMFSEPWDESDVTLVVEGERFHVHRMFLSMHSPVFKSMFSSDFKEKDAVEIPLPGKKAKEFRDLLYQVYPQQPENLTMGTVRHVLKLADEYQMNWSTRSCGKFLVSVPKTRTNAMEILLLAQTHGLTEVYSGCYDALAQLSLDQLMRLDEFEMMDGKNTRKLLLPYLNRDQQNAEQKVIRADKKVEDVLSLLRKVYPQFAGMVECALYLTLGGTKVRDIQKCPKHFSHGIFPDTPIEKRVKTCNACKSMIEDIHRVAYKPANRYELQQIYGCQSKPTRFDDNISIVLCELLNLLEL